ncbi:ABC transporter ATP-binding protein [Methylophilus sp. YYY-1]|uniref:ABC transporter ATP-binding protein n=1 Tax=Methylophilus sp. YYY-1 TaxID=2682087 RepID=UPI0023B31448|nr:ABC transporter ATP-binding protein [Methylophilus sp. YYY-1]MDF0377973.1 ATP-binding cassette domain-containing protein [Methylophilus sp. YYY-1]
MAKIIFHNVSLSYPIYHAGAMSLKSKLVEVSTGGRLSKTKKNLVSVSALENVNFALNDGDSVGLIGHNGAGKTTLLRTMAGIYTPTKGNIIREGKVSTIIELGAGLDSELTGYENIYRLGLLLGMSLKEINEILPSIESFTDLGDFLSAPVRTYSSGMLMRLMFAVTTSNQPEILLVDEMFGTGDKSFQIKARERMESIVSSAKIFVFASHSESLISQFCNRVFELSHGQLKEVT